MSKNTNDTRAAMEAIRNYKARAGGLTRFQPAVIKEIITHVIEQTRNAAFARGYEQGVADAARKSNRKIENITGRKA